MAVTKPMSDQVIPLIEQRDQLLKNRTQDALENLDATFNDYLNQLEQKGEQLPLTKTQEEFPQESHAPTSWPTHHQPAQEQRHVQVTDQGGTTHSQARRQYPNNTQLPPPNYPPFDHYGGRFHLCTINARLVATSPASTFKRWDTRHPHFNGRPSSPSHAPFIPLSNRHHNDHSSNFPPSHPQIIPLNHYEYIKRALFTFNGEPYTFFHKLHGISKTY